ncbi:hypothetical protein RHMOL_Rhmol12G0159400 [Rhododendron molle]|uniref:Uncharacterized protein n=1 Tax=Rhododendron molle TaxID=49168 RepID=A0ACC0LIZ2_RHOML|nr:hypothetical protein RHMOL_Rhmol12G0159400 [Rhododendron molle]
MGGWDWVERERERDMNEIVCVVNISQVLPSPFADPFSTRGDKKFTTKSTNPFTPSSSSPSSKLKRRRSRTIPSLNQQATNSSVTSTNEIRVCVNRTCRRQGSMETLKTLSGIAPPHVSVNSCGCLGRCGAGPNLVVLPQSTFFAHCGTPARAAQVMLELCGGDYGDWNNSLAALALRNRAEDLLANGGNGEAEVLLSQAINLKPFGGIHVLYKARSSARLVMGNMAEALEDAKEALTIAPKYPEAYICQGDTLMAMEQFDAAERSYAMALELNPSIRCSKSFKQLVEYANRVCPSDTSEFLTMYVAPLAPSILMDAIRTKVSNSISTYVAGDAWLSYHNRS